jgi:D-3-phosphoglycerate dehydrogenase
MRQGAWLVNLSRGGVVDEDALAASLSSGRLRGAAIDVFGEEPYSGPLTGYDNVVLTPHVGSYGVEARVDMEIQAVRNLIEGLRIWDEA